MIITKYKKNLIFILLILQFFSNNLFGNKYNEIIEKNSEIINKIFSNREIESLEGIWVKTMANQGPSGCVTMFYKEKNDYYQIHIDECFVVGKITGKQKPISEFSFKGENAIYFFDGKVIWEPSSIKIANDFNSLAITHGSYNNVFTEKWKRIWPVNLELYNNSLKK